MVELDGIAARADNFEQQAQQAAAPGIDEPVSGAVEPDSQGEAAGNMAESLLRVAEGAARMFVDSRLCMDESEIESGRASLGPVFDKYGLVAGDGKLPYQEELVAGFYLGGLWRRFRRAMAALKAEDKAKEKAKGEQEQSDGEERKYQPKKPAQPVPGSERVRQEPDTDTPGWLTKPGGAGSFMGHESGPSSSTL